MEAPKWAERNPNPSKMPSFGLIKHQFFGFLCSVQHYHNLNHDFEFMAFFPNSLFLEQKLSHFYVGIYDFSFGNSKELPLL